jgi:SAM-dependent methyltransferase
MANVQTSSVQGSDYIWGRGGAEIERLIAQGRFFGDLTEHLLRLAGIEPGMRVLDVGCGAGDVSFLASRLVGPEGAVIGVDISSEATAIARERARQAGLANVEFITHDAAELSLDSPVDAVIGRLVLIFCADPANLLRRLLPNVRSGGVVAFQEWGGRVAVSEPRCVLFETAIERLAETFTRAGYEVRIGLKLRHFFREAGLPAPHMLAEARVEGGPDSSLYAFVEQMTRNLLPVMEKTGVATAEEVSIETLAARLRDEAVAQDAVLVLPPLIGAWTRKDAA